MTTYRGYIITPNPFSPTLYKVATEGRGGKIPSTLEGSFTSVGTVKQQIDSYLLKLETKRGKTDSEK